MMRILSLLSISLLIIGCDPKWISDECGHRYALKTTNLKDTISTKDTVWFENDIDPHVCLSKGTYQDGEAVQEPYIRKVVNDSLVFYDPIAINIDRSDKGIWTQYYSYISLKDGRYKSKYGFIFSDPGVYCVNNIQSLLRNGVDYNIELISFFNTETNNQYLVDKKVNIPFPIGSPGSYYCYFFIVK